MYASTSCEVKITVKPAIKNDTVDVRDELWLVAVRSLCLDIWSPPSWSLGRVHLCTNKKEKVCSIDTGVEGKGPLCWKVWGFSCMQRSRVMPYRWGLLLYEDDCKDETYS